CLPSKTLWIVAPERFRIDRDTISFSGNKKPAQTLCIRKVPFHKNCTSGTWPPDADTSAKPLATSSSLIRRDEIGIPVSPVKRATLSSTQAWTPLASDSPHHKTSRVLAALAARGAIDAAASAVPERARNCRRFKLLLIEVRMAFLHGQGARR